ncbi:MAG: DUF3375 family protein [Pseudonocardiaceae bacterium]
MAERTAEQLLHEFLGSTSADVTMSLLRSTDAPLHLALMAAHLGDGQLVAGQSLSAAIDADLDGLLRVYRPTGETGEGAGEDSAGTRDGAALLTHWRRKRWVHRRADPRDPRIERYQLTSGATAAVRQVRGLRMQTSVATESALAIVMSELQQIAAEANPDPAARRRLLQDRIDELVKERDALDRGETPATDHAGLVDKLAALGQLMERIPGDVASYGEQMQANTASLLRQSLGEGAGEFAESLQRMFDGHNVIADSPQGQAFRAFATVIATPALRGRLERDIAEIVDQVEGLPAHLAEALTRFIVVVWERVQEVEEVRGVAFRRISNFVSGGDFNHYRGMRARIAKAQASAALAFQRTHGGRDVGLVVPMSGVNALSAGRLRLDPGTAATPYPVTDTSDEFDIDPAALAGVESIDWAALREAVHTAMERRSGFATLPEVLEQLPDARTGDIIGLWSLAARFGVLDEGDDSVVWAKTARGRRQITLPYAVFGEPLPAPNGPAAAPPRTLRPQLVLSGGRDD